MQGMVVSRPMGHLLALFAALATLVTLAYAQPYIASRDMLKGEFFTLALFVAARHLVMLSANNFLVVYLGLELMSLSLYALVALRRDHAIATEAAMKYFVLGALASGFLLYGLSMMYGATGSLDDSRGLRRHHHRPDQPGGAGASAWSSSSPAWPSSSAPRRSTCGCPTSTTARRRRSRC